MSTSFLEIVELDNGEIVLQRADGEGEPMLNIRFSAEALQYLAENKLDVARVMIHAGVQAAGSLSQVQSTADVEEPVVLH